MRWIRASASTESSSLVQTSDHPSIRWLMLLLFSLAPFANAFMFMSLASIISGAMALAWIKMGAIAGTVCFAFAVMAGLTVWSVASVFCSIGSRKLITGATKFFTPTGYFDLAMLQPGVGNPDVLADKPSDFV